MDVFDENNNIMYQVYPVEVEPKDRIRNNYVYVGEGNGDFIQVTRYGTEKRYNPYLTDIKKVDTVRRYVPTLP